MAMLNRLELAAMNNPVRRLVQRRFELPAFVTALERAGIHLRRKRTLDVGCGSGYSTELLHERFDPTRLCAFDLMPEQIAAARARRIPRVELCVADVGSLPYPSASFDAAFVFGILHHVPEWRTGLREIARVLAPGGVLCVEELRGRYIDFQDRYLRTYHPREARFEWPEFRAGLVEAGFEIVADSSLAPLEILRSFVARKPASSS